MVTDTLVPSLPGLLILRALEEAPAHGYKIARWIEDRSDHQLMLKECTLYPTLHQLERQGFIQEHWDRIGSRPPTKVYELTRSGREQLQTDRAQWMRRVTVAKQVLWQGGECKMERRTYLRQVTQGMWGRQTARLIQAKLDSHLGAQGSRPPRCESMK